MSEVSFVIEADSRSDMGKGASRRLRREGKVPGVLYGAGKDAVSVTLDHDDLVHHLEHEAFYSHILNVKVDGKEEQAVLKDLQRHPSKPVLLHVDFMRVSATDRIRMQVPLHFTNEDVCPGVKAGGLANHVMTEVEVLCLPKDLPEYLEVDMSDIELGQTVHLSDVKLPAGVELVELSHGPEHDLPVAAIAATRATKGAEAGEGEGEGEGE